MKLIELKCPYCGADLKVDSTLKEVVCEYCDSKLAVDDEVQHVQYDNSEQAGYEFEKGRQRAKAERRADRRGETAETTAASETAADGTGKKRRSHILLWILGWIFLFPLPITILVHRSKLPRLVKVLIIAAVWIAYAYGFRLTGSTIGAAILL